MTRQLAAPLALPLLAGFLCAGCLVEAESGGAQGNLEGEQPGERLSEDGTMHLAPGEEDPRNGDARGDDGTVAITIEENPCDEPANVLVFGDDIFGRADLVPALQDMGHKVVDTNLLPEDLTGFDAVFHVGFDIPLTADERARLALFLEFGGAVHLTGERPCCENLNGSLTALVRDVVEGGGAVTLGQQGDILDITGFQRFLYAFNPDVRSGVTSTPNQVEILRLSSPGGIAGLDPENVLAVGANDVPVGALWDKDELVGGGGRLSVVMDTNWLNVLEIEDNLPFLENLVGFMCRATPADDDEDGVPKRFDCDDNDPTVGGFLYEDEFNENTGLLAPTEQLDDPWLYEDGLTVATDGGQQAQIGPTDEMTDVVVIAKVSSRGTEAGCGNDADQVPCTSGDRWRAGVLLRAALDDDQDEGYHGYRCALASNAENGCFEDGLFLQLAEFMDAPEDDINSECDQTQDCPPNTTFDQLGRQNHDLIDLGAGDTGLIKFYAIGSDMHCQAESGSGEVISVTGSSDSFPSGTIGLSTLNIYGEFDFIRVCEALAFPGDAVSSY